MEDRFLDKGVKNLTLLLRLVFLVKDLIVFRILFLILNLKYLVISKEKYEKIK